MNERQTVDLGEQPAGHGRPSYYLAVMVGAVVVHLEATSGLLGSGIADLLTRNSEAYALMILIPLFWDLFVPNTDPRQSYRATSRHGLGTLTLWFGALLLAIVVLSLGTLPLLGIDLPQSLITLGEAPTGAVIVSGYLVWSRSMISHRRTGRHREATHSPRLGAIVYYLAVMTVAAAVQQPAIIGTPDQGLGGWLSLQNEAFAAAVLIPLYFDLIAGSRSRSVRFGWYAALVAIPVFFQTGLAHNVVPEGLRYWIETTTEAYIAAFGVSFYFDVWRPRRRPWVGHGWRSPG